MTDLDHPDQGRDERGLHHRESLAASQDSAALEQAVTLTASTLIDHAQSLRRLLAPPEATGLRELGQARWYLNRMQRDLDSLGELGLDIDEHRPGRRPPF